jgi:Cu-processing system permease protein
MRLQNIGITIQKELIETTRNRWLQGFIIIFVVLSLAIGVISSLQSGSLDLDTINRFDISVLNLTLLIVPLLGMIVGSQNIVGEKADGFLELLFAYPIRWYELVLGKYLGMLLALAIGELVGFGLVGFALAQLSI